MTCSAESSVISSINHGPKYFLPFSDILPLLINYLFRRTRCIKTIFKSTILKIYRNVFSRENSRTFSRIRGETDASVTFPFTFRCNVNGALTSAHIPERLYGDMKLVMLRWRRRRLVFSKSLLQLQQSLAVRFGI